MAGKLTDWIFGVGPECTLRTLYDYAIKERDAGLADSQGSDHAKYWGNVAAAVRVALNDVIIRDGRVALITDAHGNIIDDPTTPRSYA